MADATRHPALAGDFSEAARQAIYEVIARRRDIRNFRPDPVPEDVLLRILGAAHRAGSVGMMQPWDFILLRSPRRKEEVYELFRRANARAESRYRSDRARTYSALKLQGILDAPLSICVTCDTRRGGPHVLGRDTIPETDVYSTCLAVQNLWLAARAEGVGVGWVSIVDNAELAACLGLPEGVVPVAYLCVGFPVEFPPEPMLETTGWGTRTPLAEVVRFEGWDGADERGWEALRARLHGQLASRAPAAALPSRGGVADLAASVSPVDLAGPPAERLRARLDALAKPRGSLGRLEDLAVRLAAMQARAYPCAEERRIVVFAGDHGVCAEGVSAYLPELTARLCYNFAAGGGVINVLARSAGAEMQVVDVGVDHDFGGAPGIVDRKVARGTRNLGREPAMTAEEATRAILAGAGVIGEAAPCDILALGEVGIGNTTSAAALLSLLTGAPPAEVMGRGTGIGDVTLRRKIEVAERAQARYRPEEMDVVQKLAAVGGLEIAALAGAVLAAAARRVPVVLDGFITGVAALVAVEICPAARGFLIASHRSSERGHSLVLERLGIEPLLELELRLGEGSGAALALPMIDAACRVTREVRTFREAGIDEPLDPRATG